MKRGKDTLHFWPIAVPGGHVLDHDGRVLRGSERASAANIRGEVRWTVGVTSAHRY